MLGPGFEDARGDSKVSLILGGQARGIIPRYFCVPSLLILYFSFLYLFCSFLYLFWYFLFLIFCFLIIVKHRIMEAIFDKAQYEETEYVTRLSACYIEIYRETLFDLLARMSDRKEEGDRGEGERKRGRPRLIIHTAIDKAVAHTPKKISNIDYKNRLMIQESATKGLWIRHAKEVVIHYPNDVMQLMAHGNQNRMVAATSMFILPILLLFFLCFVFFSFFFFLFFYFFLIFLFFRTKQRELKKPRNIHSHY